ncbi:hypothetical protein [Streptomyces sp. NPDC058382]
MTPVHIEEHAIICIEEHAIDLAIMEAAGPMLAGEAPRLRFRSTG